MSGKMPQRQSLMSRHAGFLITWGFIASYSLMWALLQTPALLYFTGPK
jgi:hypothetical protein